ncbi:ATPase, partial [Streptomyces nanshensis]
APPDKLPGLLYPRTDRPAVLASFAPDVAACAAEEDPVAAGIMRAAAREAAMAAEAVCPSAQGAEVALTGGLFRTGAPLLEPLRAELGRRLPHARVVAAEGGPLDGALLVAARLAEDTLRLPPDDALLSVS